MTGADLLRGLGCVEDRFMQEALTGKFGSRRRVVWKPLLTAAACAAAAGIAIIFAIPSRIPETAGTEPDGLGTESAETARPESTGTTVTRVPAAEVTVISLSQIPINGLTEEAAGEIWESAGIWQAAPAFDELPAVVNGPDFSADALPAPEEGAAAVWTREELEAYFGRGLTPGYLPAGLVPSPRNGSAEVFYDETGALARDTVSLDFYHAYDAGGAPLPTEDPPAPLGFTLRASRLGLTSDYAFLPAGEAVQTAELGSVTLTLGFRENPCWRYTDGAYAPAGTVPFYCVRFSQDGVEYEFLFDQLPLAEAVSVVASFLLGDAYEIEP